MLPKNVKPNDIESKWVRGNELWLTLKDGQELIVKGYNDLASNEFERNKVEMVAGSYDESLDNVCVSCDEHGPYKYHRCNETVKAVFDKHTKQWVCAQCYANERRDDDSEEDDSEEEN